jgi:hypothetical protein
MSIPPDRADLPGTIVVGRVAGLPLAPVGVPEDAWALARAESTVPCAAAPAPS